MTAAELCGPQECGRGGDDKVTLGARPAPYISQSERGRPVLIVTQSHQPTRNPDDVVNSQPEGRLPIVSFVACYTLL